MSASDIDQNANQTPGQKALNELNTLNDTPPQTKEGKRRHSDLKEYFKDNREQLEKNVDSLLEMPQQAERNTGRPLITQNLSLFGNELVASRATRRVSGKGGKRTKKRKTKKSKKTLTKHRKTNRRK